MAGTPPWQGAYNQFRQLYPTGGLLLDLVATPAPHFGQYVVKATAQVGNLTLLSVLGEAPNLLGAETQACETLFQVLKLAPVREPSALDLTSDQTSPPPEVRSRTAPPPPTAQTLSPVAALDLATPDDRSQSSSVNGSPPVIPPAIQSGSKAVAQSMAQSVSKSEPYRLPQPLRREEILAPELDDWSEELAQIEIEIKRLGWTPAQESQYLQERYGKISRDHITDYGELLQFLTDLQGQPSPQRKIETWSPAPQPTSSTLAATTAFPPTVSLGSREAMMDQVLAEIRRIGWTARKGSEYLQQTYHVKTRQELTDEQLQAFILYLQHHP